MDVLITLSLGYDNANIATTIDGDGTIIYGGGSVNRIHQDSQCVVDSSASYHVTSCCDAFSTYSDGEFANVKMGNDVECRIIGMDDVCINADDAGRQLLLKNVRHVL